MESYGRHFHFGFAWPSSLSHFGHRPKHRSIHVELRPIVQTQPLADAHHLVWLLSMLVKNQRPGAMLAVFGWLNRVRVVVEFAGFVAAKFSGRHLFDTTRMNVKPAVVVPEWAERAWLGEVVIHKITPMLLIGDFRTWSSNALSRCTPVS